MKNTFISHAVVGFAGIVLGAGAVYGYVAQLPEPEKEMVAIATPELRVSAEGLVSAEGTLVIDQPDLKRGAWHVVFDDKGENYAVELAFDTESLCIGSTASGICSPGRFVENRPVEILGVVEGETLLVRELRFPVPLGE